MRSQDLKRAKRAVRAAVIARRDAMAPAERARAGAAVVERFLAMPEVAAAGVVMAFWSFGSEVPTRPLLEALHASGRVVGLPRIVAGELEVRSWTPDAPLTRTWFGAEEPSGGPGVEPDAIDVVAVPAVAFDRTCGRIGYGKGYYDRFLLRTRPDAARIGIAFSTQVVEEALPAGPFDLRVDAIVTEREILRCGDRGGWDGTAHRA
ncbi:MAG TPA: 5-formyltetrahydrofolate cyclo-ligase [Actinomycetota bacterium]